jgi:hypothetical protein
MLGMSKKPDSSMKTSRAPSLSAFFYTGPPVNFPTHNLFLVPLQSPALWFLATPSHPLKQPPHMVGVIEDAKVLVNGLGDPF